MQWRGHSSKDPPKMDSTLGISWITYTMESFARWRVIDSIHNVLQKSNKKADTLYIDHQVFRQVGFGTWNNLFPDLIEKNRCAVADENGELQYVIVRKKASWYKDHLAAWGGRLYFLPNKGRPFIEATDWIS